MSDYKRDRRRQDLLYRALVTPSRLISPRALQHLHEGFNRRLLMVEASLNHLHSTASKQGRRPLSPYAATDLAIHLNALYLNLCGALDNLAWAMQHERQLLPNTTETSKGRVHVTLFGSSFLQAVASQSEELADVLRGKAAWHAELRALRDPAAHRIPIYVVPGVMTDEQSREFASIQERIACLTTKEDREERLNLSFESYEIGDYEPIMTLSHESGLELRAIVPQTVKDETHFIEVSESVMHFLFSGATSEGVA